MLKLDPNKLLKSGDAGPEVETLQKMLVQVRARPKLEIDGDFGPNTKAAVKHFQGLRGLSVDGKVGKDTASMLNAVVKLPTLGHPEMTTEDWGKRRAKTASKFETAEKNMFADFVHARDVENDGSKDMAKVLKQWDSIYRNHVRERRDWSRLSKETATMQKDFDKLMMKSKLKEAAKIVKTVEKNHETLLACETEMKRLEKKSGLMRKKVDGLVGGKIAA